MFRSIFTTIFRGLVSSTLCSYQVEFRWCTFVVCLCSMRPSVITVGLYVCLELLSEWDLVIDQLLNWIPLMYVRCVFVQYAAVCHYRRFVCVSGAAARVRFPLRLDYGQSPNAYVNQRLQIQLELLMMSGMPLETYWAFKKRWNNKFYYKVASCWLFLLSHVFNCFKY
jgi:hypothetical protein